MSEQTNIGKVDPVYQREGIYDGQHRQEAEVDFPHDATGLLIVSLDGTCGRRRLVLLEHLRDIDSTIATADMVTAVEGGFFLVGCGGLLRTCVSFWTMASRVGAVHVKAE